MQLRNVFLGALISAAVGAVIGWLIWLSGVGFAYHWLDWPLGGAIFGFVVGGIAAAINSAIDLVSPSPLRVIMQCTGVVFGMTIGGIIGAAVLLGQGILETAIFGFFGAVGGVIGGFIAFWKSNS